MQTASTRIPWDRIDTVLVDMDGTLLDLSFDNFFWLELVPRKYAELKGLDEAAAREDLGRRYARVAGTLPWYCLDHWSAELDLDIPSLKREYRHLIRYLPMVPEFLSAARARVDRLVIVTNAHSETLAIKTEATGLDRSVDTIVCSHEFDAPKESRAFWVEFERRLPFERRRTLLIEDSIPVLEAARDYGLAHTIAIRRPDSGRPAREIDAFAAVDGVADLV